MNDIINSFGYPELSHKIGDLKKSYDFTLDGREYIYVGLLSVVTSAGGDESDNEIVKSLSVSRLEK